MGEIGYGYGSEWHLLRYPGYHRNTLNDGVLQATGGSEVEWLDLEFSRSCKPLHDDCELMDVKLLGHKFTTRGRATGRHQAHLQAGTQ
jgi:hypothetical protein